MKLCVFSPDYPTSKSIDFVFVDQLCRALAKAGADVSIIAPQTLTKCLVRHIPIVPYKSIIKVGDNCSMTLIRPKFFSGGTIKCLNFLNKGGYTKAAKRAFDRLRVKPDVCYAHFWAQVKTACLCAQPFNIPVIASTGEERVTLHRIGYTPEDSELVGGYISGVINVSSNNKNECVSAGIEKEDQGIVVPNSIDEKLFYPRDRKDSRKDLGMKDSDFLVAFVGQLVDRKGTMRVNEALKQLNDDNIKVFFIGSGPDVPDYKGIIKQGRVDHNLLPQYLSAADVFVLPTLNEGCCNAIIEAMACGLPIISSDLPFNYDILNDRNSIMVDPMNVNQIAAAIKELKDDSEKRDAMSRASLEAASELTLSKRAEKIITFIKERIHYDKD